MLARLTTQLKENIHHYWSIYKTDQIMRIYHREKYEKIATKLKTFKQYQAVQISDYSLLFFLISEENKTAIEKLLTKVSYKDLILNDTQNPSKLSPSNFAILNNLPEMSLFLQKFGANIFAQNEEGNTLLHIAAFHKNLESVKFALTHNSNINAQNKIGDTPLSYAIVQESHEIIDHLLANGASDMLANNNSIYPIHEAVLSNNLEIVKRFEHTLDPVRNLRPSVDPVHLAAQANSTEILNYLVERDAHVVNAEDSENKQTPLHFSINARSTECTYYLLERGANPNKQDKFGNTPLHFAVLNKDMELCNILDQGGANATIKNKDGLSSIDICYTDRDQTMINYFKSLNKYTTIFTEIYH